MKKAKTRSTSVLFDHTMSASTLARKAAALEKAGKKKQAQTLRDRAARLRRDERGAKHKMTGLPNREAIIKRVNQRIAEGKHSGIVAGIDPVYMQGDNAINSHTAVKDAQRSLNQMRAASVDSMALGEQPGHGEIVGGYLASKAKELAELARKKGGVDAIQTELVWLEAQTKRDAKFDACQREHKAVQAAREEMRDKIVCGFIAGFDVAESTGTMPMVWGVNSTTVASLVAALKANGYRADGKR